MNSDFRVPSGVRFSYTIYDMTITFILPSLEIAGGVRTVFELSNQLSLRGLHIRIVHCAISPWNELGLNQRPKEIFRRLYQNSRSIWQTKRGEWFSPLFAETIRIPRLRARYFPPSDILIATAWPTAEEIMKADVGKERKFYFIQGYEVCHGPEERVKDTYKLPLRRIVISSFLKGVLKTEIGVDSLGPVFMGINFSEFNLNARGATSFGRIGMLYHRHPLKGVKDGLRAFEIAQRFYPNIQLVMFGAHRRPLDLPYHVEFHHNVSREDLKRVYGSCSIWLVPSLLEGFCLIPMEAMACGCAVVSTRIGGIDDYAIPGETVLVSNPGDVNGLAANIMTLLNDKNLLLKIAGNSYQHIQSFSWTKAASNFLNCLSIN